MQFLLMKKLITDLEFLTSSYKKISQSYVIFFLLKHTYNFFIHFYLKLEKNNELISDIYHVIIIYRYDNCKRCCSGWILGFPYIGHKFYALDMWCLLEIVSRALGSITVIWRELRRIISPYKSAVPCLATKQTRRWICTRNMVRKIFRRTREDFSLEDSPTPKLSHRTKVDLIGGENEFRLMSRLRSMSIICYFRIRIRRM